MLATLLRPDEGMARVFGHDVVRDARAVRDRISLTGRYASLDDALTGREEPRAPTRLHGYSRSGAATRAGNLLDAFAWTDAADRLVRTYSGGMRRRLDIAAGLIATPDLLWRHWILARVSRHPSGSGPTRQPVRRAGLRGAGASQGPAYPRATLRRRCPVTTGTTGAALSLDIARGVFDLLALAFSVSLAWIWTAPPTPSPTW
jgi:hypothetical protein